MYPRIPIPNIANMIVIALTLFFNNFMHRKVNNNGINPGTNESSIVCTVVMVVFPSAPFTDEITNGTLMFVHLHTRAPIMNRPKIDAPSVIF